MSRRLVAVVAGLAALALAVPASAMSPTQTEVTIDGEYTVEEMLVTYTLSMLGVPGEPVEVDVTGPNGQVNHGTIVSSIVASLKAEGYRGIGCIVRHFGQTDWGKSGELDAEELALTATSYCAGPHWAGDDVDDDDDAGRGGPPEWANAKKNRAEGEGFTPPGQAKKGSQP